MDWTRRSVLKGALGAGLVAGGRARASESPPNILYIYLDQMRWDTIGALGHPAITPALDALLRTSVRFETCLTNSPICMPARATMMTGQYPHEHGLTFNEGVADASGPSHVRRVRDAGWRTALIGKAHLHKMGDDTREAEPLMRLWGFDEAIETGGPLWASNHTSAYTDWLTASTPDGRSDRYDRLSNYVRTYIAENMYTSEWATRGVDAAPWRLPLEAHLDAWLGWQASEWIAGYDRPEPFYLQLNFGGPHPPWDAPTMFRDLYDVWDPAIVVPDLTRPDIHSSPIALNLEEIAGPTSEEQARQCIALYLAKLTLCDLAIGGVLRTLAEAGRFHDTWIIVHSDHGEMLGEHGMLAKLVFYEGSVRVPLIVRPPGGGPAWTSGALTDQLDVTKTILDIAGEATDDDRGRTLKNIARNGPDAAGAHVGKAYVMSEIMDHAMIRTATQKLVVDGSDRDVEFYDLESDPGESTNQVDNPDFAADRDLLHALYHTERYF